MYTDDFDDEATFGRKRPRAGKHHPTHTKTRHKQHRNNRWQAADTEFRCAHCKQMVFLTSEMGTVHRNHCPHCLHSLHVDTRPGNRASTCKARMEPIGLTCKHNGFDKYGRARMGDIMLIHVCTGCGEVNINRIAADDCSDQILALFARSLTLGDADKDKITRAGIRLLQTDDRALLHTALFGIAR